ncbi:MAG: PBP1A family penicillin-binding protein [Steroidobacteraceae bacterium]
MNRSIPRWVRWPLILVAGLVLTGCFALACTYVYLAPSLPTAETMHSVELAVPLRVYTRNGGLIAQIGEQRRIPVTYADIPVIVRQAVLAAEDDRFFEHSGLDWMGVARAVVKNVATAAAGQGGSTITQQTARNMFLTLDKTLRRKLSEVFVTYRMERDFTKEQILATYLNVIFFGQRSYGIAAAAETFYGKRLPDLTVAEAATLAGIIQLPSRYNPVTNPKAAENRRSYVLRRMTQLGYIDQATAEAAAKEPVASRGFAPVVDVEAPYVAELARQKVVELYGEAAVNTGLKVFTTIDGRLQADANRALRVGLIEYDRRHGYRGALDQLTLPPAQAPAELDRALAPYPSVSLLQPAVVLKVADTSATIHVRGYGQARIGWDGMSWARKALKNNALGPNPRKAADVLAVGDVIYAITDRRGAAQLAQLPKAQSALVALDPLDGAVVSMVGGFDYYSNKFNRVTQARRQPGSGFKPFFYSAALEQGFTPASIILDTPVVLDGSSGEENWRPKNSDGGFGGPMRLREALVRSRNLVSIRILQNIGVDVAVEHAAKFGFDPDSLPHNLTLALGTQSVTPLQMATGFATFANGGFKVEPYYIARIEDSSGKAIFEAEPVIACPECEDPQVFNPPVAPASNEATSDPAGEPASTLPAQLPLGIASVWTPPYHDAAAPEGLRELAQLQGGAGYLPGTRLAPRVLSPQNAWLMTNIMQDVTRRGTAARVRALGRNDLAGKTGTNGERDTWFNGFNSRLVASVWLGQDDEQSLGRGEESTRTAVPIWMLFMREALRNAPPITMPRPGGLIDLKISPYMGTLASPEDPDAITETFMIQHLPRAPEPGDPFYSPSGSKEGNSSDTLF